MIDPNLVEALEGLVLSFLISTARYAWRTIQRQVA